MVVRRLIPVLLLFFPIYSQVYYLEIYNPNPYNLTDYQLKINLTQFGIPIPIAKIETLNGTNVPFCYEQPNGECNQTYSNTTEVIWIKLPYVKAKYYTYIKVIVNGTNGAVYGDRVFDFYDDFNDLDISNWNCLNGGGLGRCSVGIVNGEGVLILYALDYNNRVQANTLYNCNPMVGCVIEVQAWSNDSVDGNLIGFSDGTMRSAQSDEPFNAYMFAHARAYNSTSGIYKMQNGNPSWLAQVGDYYILNRRYNLMLVWFGNKLIAYKDGSYIASAVDTTFNSFTHIFVSASSGYWIYNWVRVRKYADSNPIVRRIHLYDKLLLQHSSNLYRYQFTYLYVIPIRVTSNNPVGITNLVIPIRLNTKDLIAQGILKSDCSDISVTIYDPSTDTEVNAKQYIDSTTCNTENTIIYVNIPEYFVGRDIFINVYLGSPSAVPIQDPETFYWFVDLSNPSDYNKIQIFTNGTASYNITTGGILINIGTDGKLVIYNK